MRSLFVFMVLGLLAGCSVPMSNFPAPTGAPSAPPADPALEARAEAVARRFVAVVDQVEPVAENICRNEIGLRKCDFRIMVDADPHSPPNAFQTEDNWGRPVIVFTVALIADARNEDELAFVLGHETAHHLMGHIDRSNQSAQAGALIFGNLASASGLKDQDLEEAVNLGAQFGARFYAKDYELEADRLGTLITYRAGFDPVRGAEFFGRIPDPGDKFLGTHPPNSERIRVVREAAAELGV
ncbi:peptidase M48-like protein [Donghicola tyrosinivorans]|uniref:Peptidase M48-like protein n=2 Tax=Donghicola tyrosinivorans TaxID=1652492 RepID=A0A2T0X0K3_9RHOB|nr:peptidase M48-like protein [Donghicola tyrosinivorans]